MAHIAELLQPHNTEIMPPEPSARQPGLVVFHEPFWQGTPAPGSGDAKAMSDTASATPPSTVTEKQNNTSASERKYKTLKRKYQQLEEEKQELSTEVTRLRKLVSRLKREKNFLLDRLLKFENVSETSDSELLESEPELNEPPRKKARLNKQPQTAAATSINETKGDALNGRGKTKQPRGSHSSTAGDSTEVKDEERCIATGKDNRPCKSKALSGLKYCWHHAPMDPNSPFIYCQYKDPKKAKSCNLPVLKTAAQPFCNYHVGREKARENHPSPSVSPTAPPIAPSNPSTASSDAAAASSSPSSFVTPTETRSPDKSALPAVSSVLHTAAPHPPPSPEEGEEGGDNAAGLSAGESGPSSPAGYAAASGVDSPADVIVDVV